MQCDQCLHVMFTMNQPYLVGGASTVSLCIFLYMQSCQVTANSYINLTNSLLLLNGYLESIVSGQGGAGYHCTAQLPLFTIVLGNRFRYLSLSL
jgi:hypothetical protein